MQRLDLMALAEDDEELTCIPMSFQDRTGHLPVANKATPSQ
jgi:hypothetical protein